MTVIQQAVQSLHSKPVPPFTDSLTAYMHLGRNGGGGLSVAGAPRCLECSSDGSKPWPRIGSSLR
jgi:hypothetical protein